MHEMGLMASIFEIAENQLLGIEYQKVLKVKLKVGKLANALEDALRMAFEAYSQDTAFAGAQLIIEEVPATWHCNECSQEFEAEVGMLLCPRCNGRDLQLIGGRDLLLESLEVD